MHAIQDETGLPPRLVAQWCDEAHDTDWTSATYLSAGAMGVVLDLGDGRVAKIGQVGALEAAVQTQLAAQNWTLPVEGFAEQVMLPPQTRQAACAVHGEPRREHDVLVRRMYFGEIHCT